MCEKHQAILELNNSAARERLLAIGVSCRALAASGRRAGLEIIAADYFADRDLQAIAECVEMQALNHLPALLRSCNDPMWVMYSGGFENHREWSIPWSPLLRLAACNRFQIDEMRSLGNLRRWAAVSDMGFPALDWEGESLRGRWLWKPFASGGGLGIIPISTDGSNRQGSSVDEDKTTVLGGGSTRLGSLVAGLHARGKGYFQELVDGIPFSAAILVKSSQVEVLGYATGLGAVDWPGPSDFIYRGSITESGISARLRDAIARLAKTIAIETEMRGLIGIDFVWQDTSDELWLLEINPRWTASMELIELVSGRCLVAEHLEAYGRLPVFQQANAAIDRPVVAGSTTSSNAGSHPTTCYGKAIYYAPRDLYIDEAASDLLANMANMSTPKFGNDMGCWLADIPMPGTSVSGGSPLLTIIGWGEGRADTLRRLWDFRLRVEDILGVGYGDADGQDQTDQH